MTSVVPRRRTAAWPLEVPTVPLPRQSPPTITGTSGPKLIGMTSPALRFISSDSGTTGSASTERIGKRTFIAARVSAVRHAGSRVLLEAASAADGRVVLRVTDDGPGIPAADRTRVFERFARLDDARSRDAGGSGLGLPIVAELVARAGGSIELTDAPDGGLRALVTLPPAA